MLQPSDLNPDSLAYAMQQSILVLVRPDAPRYSVHVVDGEVIFVRDAHFILTLPIHAPSVLEFIASTNMISLPEGQKSHLRSLRIQVAFVSPAYLNYQAQMAVLG